MDNPIAAVETSIEETRREIVKVRNCIDGMRPLIAEWDTQLITSEAAELFKTNALRINDEVRKSLCLLENRFDAISLAVTPVRELLDRVNLLLEELDDGESWKNGPPQE